MKGFAIFFCRGKERFTVMINWLSIGQQRAFHIITISSLKKKRGHQKLSHKLSQLYSIKTVCPEETHLTSAELSRGKQNEGKMFPEATGWLHICHGCWNKSSQWETLEVTQSASGPTENSGLKNSIRIPGVPYHHLLKQTWLDAITYSLLRKMCPDLKYLNFSARTYLNPFTKLSKQIQKTGITTCNHTAC